MNSAKAVLVRDATRANVSLVFIFVLCVWVLQGRGGGNIERRSEENKDEREVLYLSMIDVGRSMFYRFVGGSWWVVGTGFVGEEGASVPKEPPLELAFSGWPKEVRREKFTPAGPTVARVVPRRSLRW